MAGFRRGNRARSAYSFIALLAILLGLLVAVPVSPATAAAPDTSADTATADNTSDFVITYYPTVATTLSFSVSNTNNVIANWSDGTSTTIVNQTAVQELTSATVFPANTLVTLTITANGASPKLGGFGPSSTATLTPASNAYLNELVSFGNLGLTSLTRAFESAPASFNIKAQLPSTVTSLSWLFNVATSWNGNISGWNTSNVTNLSFTFYNDTAFNGSLAGWNTSHVTNMASMFAYARSFNSSLSTWNTSSVTSMNSMFLYASAFNGSLAGWDTSHVTDMSSMFFASSFNDPSVSALDVSSVTAFGTMFDGNTVFNQSLNSWNTVSATDLDNMFRGATAFNQPLGSWNTSNVTNMSYMFWGATAFNQNISTWNVGKVANMSYMFYGATSFNQPLSGWKTPQLYNMSNMFYGATRFNQNLASFNITALGTSQTGIFASTGMSSANLDRTLQSWSYQSASFTSARGGIDGPSATMPKWSTCAGYYAYLNMNYLNYNSGSWATASPAVPSGCVAQHVTWSSASSIWINSTTAGSYTPTSLATTDSANPVAYVLVKATNSNAAACQVDFSTGVFTYQSTAAASPQTCVVRAYDTSPTSDHSSSNYVDVTYMLNRTQPLVPSATTITSGTPSVSSASLIWSSPASNGSVIQDFAVRYSVDAGATWTTFVHSPSSLTFMTVTGLPAATSISFQVAAVNGVGQANWSSSYTETTAAATIPGAPTLVTASSYQNAQSTVSFTAPTETGGTPITGYTVTSSPGNFTCSTSGTTSCVVSGLLNGTSYTFTVTATNAVGTSAASAASSSAIPANVPNAPTSVAGSNAVAAGSTITWTAPSSNGGAPITGYKVEYSTDGTNWITATANTGSTTVSYALTGLQNGQAYHARVSAINAAGTSSSATSASTFTPTDVPGVPTNVVAATGSNASSTVTWTTPSSNGGLVITGYKVEYSTNGTSWTVATANTASTATAYTINGLTNGQSYTARVSAINSKGTGSSATSNAFTPSTTSVPGAPTNVTAASNQNGQSTISWTAPASNGGSAITGYTVTSTPGNFTCTVTSTSCTVSGLTNGTSYTFTVVATNALGNSVSSAASAAATPATTSGAPVIASFTNSGTTATLVFTAPSTNGGSAITGYRYRSASTVGGLSSASWNTLAPSATSVNFAGLTLGQTLVVEIQASNAAGYSASATTSQITIAAVPGAPQVYSGVRSTTQLEVVAFAPTDGGSAITGYQYRYSTDQGANWTTWAAAPTASATTAGGSPALDFLIGSLPNVGATPVWVAVQIKAQNAVGLGPVSVQVPNTVDITSTSSAAGSVTFSYHLTDNGNSPVTDFQYQLGDAGGQNWGAWTSMATTSDAQPFTVSGLTNGVTYSIRVRAVNAVGAGSGSQSNAAAPPTAVPNKPLPVVSLTYGGSVAYSNGGTVAATVSNTGDGIATYSAANSSVCSVDSTTGLVTIVGLGVCSITLTDAEGNTFRGGSATATLTVTAASQAPLVWNVPITSAPYMGSIVLDVTGGSGTGAISYATNGNSTCTIVGSIVVMGSVGTTCSVTATKGAAGVYAAASTSPIILSSTQIAQSAVVPTFGTAAFVDQSLQLQATGGNGAGDYQYAVSSAGTTGCVIDPITNQVSFTAAGTCTISVSKASSVNYLAGTAVTVQIVVSRRAQSLHFTSAIPTQPVVGDVYTPVASSSIVALPVVIAVTSGSCALTSGDVRFNGVGACVLTASQAGTDLYTPASTIQTITVGQRNQILTFDSATTALSTRVYGSAGFAITATSSESGALVSYALSSNTTNSACSVTTAGFVTILNVGTCAINADAASGAGYSAASTIEKVINVVADLPGAPAVGSVSAGNMHLTVGFFAPSYTGGTAITGYRLVAIDQTPGSSIQVSDSSCGTTPVNSTITCVLSGLTNGLTYKVKVAAINTAGVGAFSPLSSAITVAANPSAVQNLSVAEGNASLTITWSQPESLGGGVFSAYRIFIKKSSSSNFDQAHFFNVTSFGQTSATVTSESPADGLNFLGGPALVNGVGYDVKVVTVTTANLLELDANTATVNQIPHTVPNAPATAASFVVGNQLVITWSAPTFDGGKPVSAYSVTLNQASCNLASPTDTQCAVPLPTAPGTYTFQVTAANDAGNSAPASGVFYVAAVQAPVQSNSGNQGNSSSTGPDQAAIDKAANAPAVSSLTLDDGKKSVTVTGANLATVSSVLVGGIAVKIGVVAAGQLVFDIPDLSAGSYDVVINFADGSSLTEPKSVVVQAAVPPVPVTKLIEHIFKVSGFQDLSAVISSKQRKSLLARFAKLPPVTQVACVAFVPSSGATHLQLVQASRRAKTVCALAKTARITATTKWRLTKVAGVKASNRVEMRIWTQATNATSN